MKILISTFLFFIFNFSIYAHASQYLYGNQTLSNNQSIVTPTGNYQLIMQSDGSLVMYRADGTIRYSMAKHGSIAVMQTDGNFVEYDSNWNVLFNTGTGGQPLNNNFLAIQDDGNLVIYSQLYIPAWNIGVEPGPGDPKNIGDVVGRDLAFTGAGYLGHLGIFDGSQIVQVGPPVSGSNAVHYESLQNFKNTLTNTGAIAKYWGVAKAPIADGAIYECYQTSCTVSSYETTPARVAAAKRARQIYLIGADYTATASSVGSVPGNNSVPPRRGVYRCDTFVIDVLYYSTNYRSTTTILTQAQSDWYYRMSDLLSGAKAPQYIFNKIRDYN